MIFNNNYSSLTLSVQKPARSGERGAALATAILMLGLLSAITMTVLAVVTTETRVAGGDLQRTQAFYAAASGIEKMSSDFNALFARTSRPTQTQLNTIAAAAPDLAGEGFSFTQSILKDEATLATMRATQNIPTTGNPPVGANPTVTVPNGPLVGLTASVVPYILNTTATSASAQVNIERRMNNYLVPIFQFGMFSNEDMEMHPGPTFTFNGRVHANGNLYLNGNVTFLDKVTTASEVVRDVMRNHNPPNNATHTGTVTFNSGTLNVGSASVILGPNTTLNPDPSSPAGTINASWKTNSVATYAGQLLTGSTGVAPLKLPLQLDGNPTREIIKRRTPNDDVTLSDSRYHTKAEIRILIDDEGVTTDAARSDASPLNGDGTTNAGVNLSTFNPIPLPNAAVASGGGRALWRLANAEIAGGTTYLTDSTNCVLQELAAPSPSPTPTPTQALTVRGVRSTTQSVTLHGTPTMIPAGSGLTGHILIQIVDSAGVARDVTTQILSMGMTEGEPNGIVYLQRPLWAAYLQGTRDADGTSSTLKDITDNYWGADGEIGSPTQNDPGGFLTGVTNDSSRRRAMTPPAAPSSGNAWASNWNSIVPINTYNVREGRINDGLAGNSVFERGLTSIIEINMKNLARWVDGVYDANLLVGTPAVSGNIASPDGYIVYVSDRRGDKIKSEVDSSGATVTMTNGMCDNEDIYGPNSSLDPGEDVIDFLTKKNTLQKDTTELPDPAVLTGASTSSSSLAERTTRAHVVAAWTNPSNYFRRAVRLFNGEDLRTSVGATTSLSTTKGISVASENMIYIWGNYNTTGINQAPGSGTSSLNESTAASRYCPGAGSGAACGSTTERQVPASVVCDAYFQLSKTWFDATTAMYPDNVGNRPADRSLPGVTGETAVRAGVIAGNNLSALSAGSTGPDAGNYSSTANDNESRLCGGMHNFPRFLENWPNRFNFVGSLIPLYHSTQAVGQYSTVAQIYGAPLRNWAFDVTFRQSDRLPPGTPQFQYIEPTAFRQVLY